MKQACKAEVAAAASGGEAAVAACVKCGQAHLRGRVRDRGRHARKRESCHNTVTDRIRTGPEGARGSRSAIRRFVLEQGAAVGHYGAIDRPVRGYGHAFGVRAVDKGRQRTVPQIANPNAVLPTRVLPVP